MAIVWSRLDFFFKEDSRILSRPFLWFCEAVRFCSDKIMVVLMVQFSIDDRCGVILYKRKKADVVGHHD